MLDRLRVIGVFDNHVRFREPLFDIADFHAEMAD